ncbi:MAG: hypothetical protein OHK006_12260 [Thermodesulfovibrionales bacterium]
MPNIVGVKFKSCGKVYDFEAGDAEYAAGAKVVIESEFGLSIGQVVARPRLVDQPKKDIKKVLRLATDEDFLQKKENEKFEKEARAFCYERISARGLPMKLVCAEATLDRKRIVFYFTADGRIDFRELVKDLASKFKTRIELRQIGVRDKAKLVGGIGMCGQELCCRVFLTSFEPISIKMAKQQDLTLNTGKLSGCCGRLMCCLGYEYIEGGAGRAKLPKDTPAGEEQRRGPAPSAREAAEWPSAQPAPAETPAAPAQEPAVPAAQPPAQAGQPEAQPQEGQAHRRRRRRRRNKQRPAQNG